MFQIKQFVNRITDNRNEREGGGETSASFVDNEEQHSAEGFLCPPCMKAFPSPEALEEHYKKTHENDTTSSDSNSNSNEVVQVLRQEIQRLQDCLTEEKVNSEEMKKEVLKMHSDLNAKDFDTSSLRSQEKEFEESKTLLTSEVTLLRQQLADSLEQISMLRKEKESVASRVDSSSVENEQLKKEVASLQTQLSHRNSVDDAEVLRQELVSVQKLMDQLALEKEKEIETLNNKLNELPPSISTDKLNEQLNETLQELQVLKQKNSVDEQKHIEMIQSYKDEISLKNAKISEMDNSTQTNMQKIEMLNQECLQLKEECSRLRDQHTELCSKIETGEGAKAALEGLQQENLITKKNLDESHSQNRELSKQNHDLTLSLERSQAEIKVIQAEVVNKQKELDAQSASMNEVLAAKKKENQDLSKSIHTYSIQVQQNESELKTLKGDRQRLEEQVSKLEVLCENWKAKEAEQEKAISKQVVQMKTLQEAVNTAELSLAAVKKEIEVSNAECKSAQANVDELKVALKNKAIELKKTEENYENQLKNMAIQLSSKETELAEKSKEILNLQNTLEEQTSALKIELRNLEKHVLQMNGSLEEKNNFVNELTGRCNEMQQNLQLLQSKVEEVIQHKLELEKTCESNEEEKSQLLEKLIFYESETKSLNTAIEELTRKRDDAMAALQELGRENQSLQIEMAKIQGRKWADDSNVPNCSNCTKEFTLTFRKHHCRHCGQIFCSDCSSKSASVPSSKKPVRVCDGCFVKLTTQ